MDWNEFCKEYSIGMHQTDRYFVLRLNRRKMFVPVRDFPDPKEHTVGAVLERVALESRRLEKAFTLGDWAKALDYRRVPLSKDYSLTDHFIRMVKQRDRFKKFLPPFTYQQVMKRIKT